MIAKDLVYVRVSFQTKLYDAAKLCVGTLVVGKFLPYQEMNHFRLWIHCTDFRMKTKPAMVGRRLLTESSVVQLSSTDTVD